MALPDFPTDPTTLDMLMLAIDGGEGSERSSVWDFLDMMSTMGGSDITAVSEVIPGNPLGLDIEDAETDVMRDAAYHEHDVLRALITEIRRMRAARYLDDDNYAEMQRAYGETLELLAVYQGRHRACEEIIARTRELAESYMRPPMTHAGTPLIEGAVPVSEILTALGPEPPDASV